MGNGRSIGRFLWKASVSTVLLSGLVLYLGSVSLEFFLPPERLRALIIEHGRRSLGMDVRLRDLSIGWFSGIELRDLAIGAQNEPFARVDNLTLGLRWLPLLERRLVIGSVRWAGMEIRLLRDDDGNLILPGKPKKSPPPPPSSAPRRGGAPFELAVGLAEVFGGRLIIEGRGGDIWDFTLEDVAARDLRLEGPFEVRARGKASWSRSGGKAADVEAVGLLDLGGLKPGRMSFQGQKTDLRWGPWKLDGRVEIRDFRRPSLEWRGTLRGHPLPGSVLGVNLPGFELPDGARLSGDISWAPGRLSVNALTGEIGSLGLAPSPAGGRLRFKARGGAVFEPGKAPGTDLLLEVELQTPSLAREGNSWLGRAAPKLTLPALDCRSSLRVRSSGLKVESLRCRAPGASVEASGTLTGWPPRAVSLRTTSGQAELNGVPAFIPPGAKVDALGGPATFYFGIEGPIGALRWETAVHLPQGSGNWSGLEISELRAGARLEKRRVTVGPYFEGLLLGSTFQGLVNVYIHPNTPAVAVNLSLAGLELVPLFKALKDRAAAHAGDPDSKRPPKRWSVSGALDIGELRHPTLTASRVRVDYELTVSSGLRDVAGWAKLKAAGGRLEKLEGGAADSAAVRTLLLPLLVLQKIGNAGPLQLLPDLNDVQFNEIRGDYIFKGGVMEVRNCVLKGPKLELGTRGTIDLPTGRLELTIRADVSRLPTPLEFGVAGTVAKPVTSLDKGKLITEPLFQILKGEPIKKLIEAVIPGPSTPK